MSRNAIPEIERIVGRLGNIREGRTRLNLSATAIGGHQELLREEHRLEIRLTEIRDRVAGKKSGSAEERAAGQTDLTRTPRLPESRGSR